MNSSISRRTFLKGSLAATGLTLAVSVTPLGYRLLNASEGKKGFSGFKPSVWLEITPDNSVTIIVGQCEMGQGTHTSLCMILADELEADWKQLQDRQGGAREEYKNPITKSQLTAGSVSVRSWYGPLRKLGAAGRKMLVQAAASTWNCSEKECAAFKGTVRNNNSGRSLTYGELCLKAAELPVPQNPPLKKESEFRYIGNSVPRVDIPAKLKGTAIFGFDFSVPDMYYAVLARPPAYGAKVISYDLKAAQWVKGVSKVVPGPRGVAVVAETLDAAWKGRDALNVKWNPGSFPHLNNERIEKLFMEHLNKAGAVAIKEGDAKKALALAGKKIEATYFTSYVAHATLEPMNCTAHVRKDRCDVWAPTQFQTMAQGFASRASGLPPDKVHIHALYSGGAFGRRVYADFVEEAVMISRAVSRPVKMVWTREEDMQNDLYRPAMAHKIEAGLDSIGRLMGWSQRAVCPSIMKIFNPKDKLLVDKGLDLFALWGIWDLSPHKNNTVYEIPNFLVEQVILDLPIPVGVWRSVQNGPNAFVVESFMDELAHAAGKDPLEFRLQLLKNQPRPRRVLETVAEKAGWGKPIPKGMGRGIAQHSCFESFIAHVADVSVNKKDGKIRVHKIVSAIECGPAVDPDNIKNQIEGGTIQALSTALKEQVIFENGGVKSSNYDNYDILRLDEAPEIEVHVVKSSDKIGGIGELGIPATAPAVANAVFNATGARIRRIPMDPKTVLAAL